MNTVRCSICLQQYLDLKCLSSHYLSRHSKIKIIKELLKSSILLSTPNIVRKKYRYKPLYKKMKKININPKYPKTQTIYLNENIHILCGQNEIIIGDAKSSVDTEFSFDETSCESKENFCIHTVPVKNPLKQYKAHGQSKYNTDYCSGSPSASSEHSNTSQCVNKRKIKRKKKFEKTGHYRIDITKLHNQQSLDDQTGEFYICHCREKEGIQPKTFQRSDLKIITSDTESCSDTGKNLFMPIIDTKLFCSKCGSGYKTENELAEHMYIHETFCRLCNTSFSSEYSFKEHMRQHIFKVFVCHICNAEFPFRDMFGRHFECHIEDRTFENVLDMEEDYKTHSYNFMSMNYNNSISNILYFLSENHDVYYYSYRFMKIVCDMCWNEVFVGDYERHLQNVHYSYKY